MKAKTKNVLTACVALALVACAVLGTIAYMTATSDKTNEFTVGKFDHPTTDPDDPSKTIEVNGYILEKNWDAATEHKLVPGNTLDKDPRIGIGKGSEDAYVYAFVKNGMAVYDTTYSDTIIRDGSVYFALNSGWEFVAVDGVDYKELTVDGKKYYTGGLFKYNTKLSATADADAWTGTVFDKVVCGKDMNTAAMAGSDNNNIVVSAYIHQATDGNGSDLATTAETAAKAWAAELVK